MLSKVFGAGLCGTDGFLVSCEADVENGFPQITFIGSLSSSVRESADRVRTAVSNSGIFLEPRRVTINLSPAELRKDGCGYDVPIAVSLLRAYGMLPERFLSDSLFVGELSLGGEVLPVNGVNSMVSAAADAGLRRCFLPVENLREGSVISGIACYGVHTLFDLVDYLTGRMKLPEPAVFRDNFSEEESAGPDFSEISGQDSAVRAALLSAGGRHNLILIGPAGTGKSMIAERIPTILPEMTHEERLELSRVYSIAGLLDPEEPLMRHRPFRAPHHTATPQSLTGGGSRPKPGEISLSEHGVLFLDELPEFRPESLEVLRQPLEERKVRISRVNGNFTFPANFQLVCAMNPCRCGFWPDRTKCRCSEQQVRSYLGRISKPLLDRIDIAAETSVLPYDSLNLRTEGRSSREFRKQVEKVRAIQAERFRGLGIRFNSEMNAAQVKRFCRISASDEQFLKEIYERCSMSARALHKILKVARTAADFAGSAEIRHEDLCEAVSFRMPEEKFFGAVKIRRPAYGRT